MFRNEQGEFDTGSTTLSIVGAISMVGVFAASVFILRSNEEDKFTQGQVYNAQLALQVAAYSQRPVSNLVLSFNDTFQFDTTDANGTQEHCTGPYNSVGGKAHLAGKITCHSTVVLNN